jgi:hypothetical protein
MFKRKYFKMKCQKLVLKQKREKSQIVSDRVNQIRRKLISSSSSSSLLVKKSLAPEQFDRMTFGQMKFGQMKNGYMKVDEIFKSKMRIGQIKIDELVIYKI